MSQPRSRPVMTLSEGAVDRIRQVTANSQAPIVGIRVEEKGVKILIEPTAILFLLGTELDFKVDKLKAAFVFNNPNQSSACGCGDSAPITPAAHAQIETAKTA